METKQDPPWFGCLFLGAVAAFVGSFFMGGTDEPVQSKEPTAMAIAHEVTSPSPASIATVPPTADVAPPSKPKPIKLSDLDESDRAIRLAINRGGHLCARPIEVQEVGTGLYGVQCITNRDGTGLSNYLVNSRTNEVEAI